MVTSGASEYSDWASYPDLSVSLGKCVVLALLDDFARHILLQRFRMLGYEVLEAANGRAALELLQNHHADMLVADWDLPLISGEDLCRRIKNNPDTSHTYVILLVDRLLKRRGRSASLESGADEYVVTPCDPRDLKGRMWHHYTAL